MTTLTPAESRILEMSRRGYSDEEIVRDYQGCEFAGGRLTLEKVRAIREAAEGKLQTTSGGEWWNK